jgi:hypothetical protein
VLAPHGRRGAGKACLRERPPVDVTPAAGPTALSDRTTLVGDGPNRVISAGRWVGDEWPMESRHLPTRRPRPPAGIASWRRAQLDGGRPRHRHAPAGGAGVTASLGRNPWSETLKTVLRKRDGRRRATVLCLRRAPAGRATQFDGFYSTAVLSTAASGKGTGRSRGGRTGSPWGDSRQTPSCPSKSRGWEWERCRGAGGRTCRR